MLILGLKGLREGNKSVLKSHNLTIISEKQNYSYGSTPQENQWRSRKFSRLSHDFAVRFCHKTNKHG